MILKVTRDNMFAVVNGIIYNVPKGTTLKTLEKHLPFKLEVCDDVDFITFEICSASLFGPEKETYVSPFTGKTV